MNAPLGLCAKCLKPLRAGKVIERDEPPGQFCSERCYQAAVESGQR